jgi:ribosomal protein S25
MSKKKEMTQREKVYRIVLKSKERGVFTPQVTGRALNIGIGCADRRLRELQESGSVESYSVEGHRTKLWIADKYL